MKIQYYNPMENFSACQFGRYLRSYLEEPLKENREIVLLCIGTDRATGDCLGPIVGYKLNQLHSRRYKVYGTLAEPVHAKNLTATLKLIETFHPDAFVIAIDASLGSAGHIGLVTVGEGPLYPGIGVSKELPGAGDIYITGIVNLSGMLSQSLLQTTRLDVVMKMADFICMGIRYCFAARSAVKTFC